MFESVGHGRSWSDGAIIFEESEPGRKMYVIESGTVRLTRKNTRESETIVSHVADIGPGEMLGEMSLFDVGMRSATAMAVGEVRAREIARKDLEEAIRKDPDVAFELLARMSERIRRIDSRIEQLLVREELNERVIREVSALRYPECLMPPIPPSSST